MRCGGWQIVFATLKAGAYFGELAMFTSQRRTASARALHNCVLYTLSVGDFEKTIQRHPKYYDAILNKAMEQLNKTLNSNKDFQACATRPWWQRLVPRPRAPLTAAVTASRMAQEDWGAHP